MKFGVFDAETGALVRWGEAALARDVPIQAGAGEVAVICDFSTAPVAGGFVLQPSGAVVATDLPAPAPDLRTLRGGKTLAVRQFFASSLAAGLAQGGLRIALDDGSRANLTAMAVTANMALAGALPWPSDYARGWVAISGERLSLPTPQDGIALALAAGSYYAALVQHGQDLLDAVAAAADPNALASVDITAGWPA